MFFLILAVGLVLLGATVIYNRLIRDRNRVDSAWSDIDVQLQRRHDLIPQLVRAVEGYSGYERSTLEAVTSLRAAAVELSTVADRGRAEEELSQGVTRYRVTRMPAGARWRGWMGLGYPGNPRLTSESLQGSWGRQ